MIEAMKLALEALKELVAQTENSFFSIKHDHVALQNSRSAIAKLNQAIEQVEKLEVPYVLVERDGSGKTVISSISPEALGHVKQYPKCNPHPKAPHGFDRNASHGLDRHVCECESWDAYDAGIEEGMKRERALWEMAENARELGLNHEQPAQNEPVCDKDPYLCWFVRCQLGKVCKNARNQQLTQGCDYCNHPQYAGIKCKNCGRVTEQPAQDEPMALQMDVIVVNLVREGINKHRARELAEHFIKHARPQAREPLTDEQCDAIYNALDVWAREFDRHEFGLPATCGGGMEGGRAIIRAAHGIKE